MNVCSIIPATKISYHGFMPKKGYRKCSSKTVAMERMREENVVIVGAGIAGLATSLALHRLGIKSLVLEKAPALRKGGTSLTLFKNGWRVLDDLGVGVASGLRQTYNEILELQIQTNKGRILRTFSLKADDESQEVRGVERSALLASFANELPADTILFNSTIKSFENMENDKVKIALDDGTLILTKVWLKLLLEIEGRQHKEDKGIWEMEALIGCDGISSAVARWMGFSEPRYVGHCAFRGLGVYSNGQPFDQKVHYIYGKGIRAAYVPLSFDKVYWFIRYNSPSPGPKITDPNILREEALQLVRDWPQELLQTIAKTPNESIVKTPLADRWLWPYISPKSASGCVALAGDAWHPMTPNLGQGACCALEDSIVLSKKIAKAFGFGEQEDGILKDNFGDKRISTKIDTALKTYTNERWPQVFYLTIKSNVMGAFLQFDNGLFCTLRDNIIIPKVAQLSPMLEHTNYDCGSLSNIN